MPLVRSISFPWLIAKKPLRCAQTDLHPLARFFGCPLQHNDMSHVFNFCLGEYDSVVKVAVFASFLPPMGLSSPFEVFFFTPPFFAPGYSFSVFSNPLFRGQFFTKYRLNVHQIPPPPFFFLSLLLFFVIYKSTVYLLKPLMFSLAAFQFFFLSFFFPPRRFFFQPFPSYPFALRAFLHYFDPSIEYPPPPKDSLR